MSFRDHKIRSMLSEDESVSTLEHGEFKEGRPSGALSIRDMGTCKEWGCECGEERDKQATLTCPEK